MTKQFIFTLSLLIAGISGFSQAEEHNEGDTSPAQETIPSTIDSTKVYPYAEVAAEYVGGTEALYRDISSELTYPKKARKAEIQGVVFVQFIVERDGSISNIKVIRGVEPETLDKEALRVVSKLKRWKPAMQNGKTVRMQFNLPIRFQLTD